MRIIIFIALCTFTTNLYSKQFVVFEGTPNKKGNNILSKKLSKEYQLKIIKSNKNYIWQSRAKKELTHSKSGIFDIFIANDGSGLISIMNNKALDPNSKFKYSYGEHIRNGINLISYYGNSNSLSLY